MTDLIITPADEPVVQDSLMSRIAKNLKEVASVSEIMRMIGALIMVASMSLFLLQDWDQGSDVSRYFSLLIQTVLLAGGGLAMSFLLKENKGARVFFNLSLISVVANFTILGALLYSTVQWDNSLMEYPQYAKWVVPPGQSVMMAMLAAAAVLLPVTLFGFMITARPVAKQLAVLYLALNALLLLPVRDSLFTGVIALAGLLILPWVLKKLFVGHEHAKTSGGHLIKALLFAPLVIMLTRSAMWYLLDGFLMLSVFLAVFLILRSFSLQEAAQKKSGLSLATLADTVGYLSSFGVAVGIMDLSASVLPADLRIPVFLVVLAGLSFELLARSKNTSLKTLVSVATGGIFAGGFIFNMMVSSGGSPIVFCLVASIALIAYSWLSKQRWVLIPGAIALGSSLVMGSGSVYELAMGHGWISLAITGAVIIVLASVLERHGVALKMKLQGLVVQY